MFESYFVSAKFKACKLISRPTSIRKSLFGIGDSKYMGNLSKNFAKTAAAVGSGINMAKRTAETYTLMKLMLFKNENVLSHLSRDSTSFISYFYIPICNPLHNHGHILPST